MRFSDIPGLPDAKQKLLALVTQNRLPHALLINGPEGSGKLALGLAFAAFVQCEQSDLDACGVCNACVKTFKLIHPDIHYFFPISGTDATTDESLNDWRKIVLHNPYLNANQWQAAIEKENKLLNISAKECKNMVKKLTMTIYEGKRRILLIWLPEFLGVQANILLKLIEEPPANSLIILVTESVQSILPTIVSRCQTLNITGFDDQEIMTALQQTGIKDATLLRGITRVVEGNMMEALNLAIDQANPHSEKMISWLRLCFTRKAEDLLVWIEQFASEGRDIHRQFLKFGLKYLEQILTYKITQKEEDNYNLDEWKGIKGLAKQMTLSDITHLETLFSNHIYFVERNAHPKILFTALSINVGQVLNHRSPQIFKLI